MKKYSKSITNVLITCLFLFVAYGSGEEEKQKWRKNSKDIFCGKKFTKSNTIEITGKTEKSVTILNCDGTYTSIEDYNTSNLSKEIYGNSISHSGTNNSFSGTWEILENNLPPEIENYFIKGGFKADDYTVIKYRSSNGKERFAYIQFSEDVSDLYLGLVILDGDSREDEGVYYAKDFDMFEGLEE
jgi:hypothetical protein